MHRVDADIAAGRLWRACAAIEAFQPRVQERLRAPEGTGGRWRPARRDGHEPPAGSTAPDLAGVAGCAGLWRLAVVPCMHGVMVFFS